MARGYQYRNQQRLGFLCQQELADRIERTAKALDMPMTELMRQAIVAFLDGVDDV